MSVNAGPPATAADGLRLPSTGAKTANETALETSALLTTVTGKLPIAVTRAAGTVALSCVPLMKVVGRLVLPNTAWDGTQFVPLQFGAPTKPVPFSVKMNPAPSWTEDTGERAVTEGSRAVTWNGREPVLTSPSVTRTVCRPMVSEGTGIVATR